MKLAIITLEYPSEKVSIYPFVDQLACGLADAGVEVTVIAPMSVTKRIVRSLDVPPAEAVRQTENGARFPVYRPRYASFATELLGVNTAMLTYKGFKRAVLREMRARNIRPDALYGHFVAPSGLCASELGTLMGIPAFLGYGDSSTAKYAMYDRSFVTDRLNALSGIVSVSSEGKRVLIDEGYGSDPGKIGVFPNAINRSVFHPMDRALARAQLGFDGNDFIVSFVGSFVERKGVRVLSRALDSLGDVKSIFIGSGALEPDCRNILHKGTLINREIPTYLNASDIFVLPTLAEGCCNAIIEAMGCALPVVSSDRAFNRDILDESNSLLVDPTSVSEVARAISVLRDDHVLRARLAEGALRKAEGLTTEARALAIRDFIKDRA